MAKASVHHTSNRAAGVALAPGNRSIPVFAFGLGLSVFFMITFTLCILGYLWLPLESINHSALSIFLPGFELLSWHSYFLGLGESFAYGWYIALVFGPIYNFCASRMS